MLVNGIVWGCGDVFAMVFSSWLMGRMHDITAFRVCYLLGVMGYAILIFFPDNETLPYFGILFLVMSIGGWGNTFLLILELRVPPQNIASISIIIKTISIGAAISCPTISGLDKPLTLISLAGLAFFAMLMTFCLPKPG